MLEWQKIFLGDWTCNDLSDENPGSSHWCTRVKDTIHTLRLLAGSATTFFLFFLSSDYWRISGLSCVIAKVYNLLILNRIREPTISLQLRDNWNHFREGGSTSDHIGSSKNSRVSIPVGDSDYSFVLCSWHVDHIISHFFTEVKIYHHSLFFTDMTISTLLVLVYGPACHESFVAQWLEHPTGVRKVLVSIPVGDSHFFFVPCSWHVNHIISQSSQQVRLHGTLSPSQMTLLPREVGVVRVTWPSRDKFSIRNNHGYVKKKKETAHDI